MSAAPRPTREHVARMMDSIGHTIGYVLTVFAVAIVMLVLDWRLALVVLIPLPFVTRRGAGRTRGATHARTRAAAGALGRGGDAGRGDRQRHPRREGPRRRATRSPREFRDAQPHESSTVRSSIARLDAVFMPILEMLPLLGIARRALARRPARDRRRPHRSARSSLSTRTWRCSSGRCACSASG